MAPHSLVAKLLNRAGLALLGLVIALLGAGVIVLGFVHVDAGSVGTITAVGIGLLLVVAGLRQLYLAVTGQLPSWYTEFVLFAGGVIGSGGPRADE